MEDELCNHFNKNCIRMRAENGTESTMATSEYPYFDVVLCRLTATDLSIFWERLTIASLHFLSLSYAIVYDVIISMISSIISSTCICFTTSIWRLIGVFIFALETDSRSWFLKVSSIHVLRFCQFFPSVRGWKLRQSDQFTHVCSITAVENNRVVPHFQRKIHFTIIKIHFTIN